MTRNAEINNDSTFDAGQMRLYIIGLVVALVTLTGLVAVVLIVNSGQTVTVDNLSVETIRVPIVRSESPQALALQQVTLHRRQDGIEGLDVTVRNISDSPQTGIVWYILTKPEQEIVWQDPEFESERGIFNYLAPGEQFTTTLAPPPTDELAGQYRLSVWVHQLDEGQTITGTHADGTSYNQLIWFGEHYNIEINNVQIRMLNAQFAQVEVTISISNASGHPAELGFAYTLADETSPTPWLTGYFIKPFAWQTMDAGEAYTITYRDTVPRTNTPLRLQAWLHRRIDGTTQPYLDVAYPEMVNLSRR